MQAFGLYTHIRANRIRSVLLLGGLFLLIYVMVFAGALLAEAMGSNASLSWLLNRAWQDLVQALPWATIGTLAWIGIAYSWHQNMIDAVTGGQEVTRAEAPRLYNLLENLCIARGMTMPRLKVMPTAALNAFASGLNEKQYAISVTSGLLAAMDDAELEAVLGHELTHIRNGDVRLLVIALVIAGVLSFIGEMIFRLVFQTGGRISRRRDDDRKGGGALPAILIAVGLIALAWVLSLVIRFALSRSREFLADAGSVELTHNADAMISALRKIEGRGEIEGATSAVMEMCVDNPREGFADLFATHPSVDARVAALVRFAGGHDPGPLAVAAPEPEGGFGTQGGGPWDTPSEPTPPPGAPPAGPWGNTPSS